MITLRDFAVYRANNPINMTIRTHQAIRVIAHDSSLLLAVLKVLSGVCGRYNGNIFVNDYCLRSNILQFQEHVHSVLCDSAFYPYITLGNQLRMLSKKWSGFDLSGAAVKVFKISNYCDKLPLAVRDEVGGLILRKFELAKLLCCPATIWVILKVDSCLDEEGKQLMYDLIVNRIAQGGIVIFTSDTDKFDDIVSHTMNIS